MTFEDVYEGITEIVAEYGEIGYIFTLKEAVSCWDSFDPIRRSLAERYFRYDIEITNSTDYVLLDKIYEGHHVFMRIDKGDYWNVLVHNGEYDADQFLFYMNFDDLLSYALDWFLDMFDTGHYVPRTIWELDDYGNYDQSFKHELDLDCGYYEPTKIMLVEEFLMEQIRDGEYKHLQLVEGEMRNGHYLFRVINQD